MLRVVHWRPGVQPGNSAGSRVAAIGTAVDVELLEVHPIIDAVDQSKRRENNPGPRFSDRRFNQKI